MGAAAKQELSLGSTDRAPAGSAPAPSQLFDSRFRALVGEEAWAKLPEAVRRRFSKRIAPGTEVVYRGEVVSTQLSRLGRVLAQLARVIGGPLPLDDGATGASVVTVTEDAGAPGQTWTRSYARAGRRPQVIRSMKCFRGPTGLEEHVGAGIGMALSVTVKEGALYFRSDHYFLELAGWRLTLPRFLEPGRMEIVHADRSNAGQSSGEAFSFQLTLDHPLLGRMLHQLAHFHDPCARAENPAVREPLAAPRDAR